ncbi:MAG: transposase [Thermoanaerobaculia bacterium]|jgi:transposase
MDEIYLTCPRLTPFGFPRIFVMPNGTDSIRETLGVLRAHADAAGIRHLRIVVEPTGIYGELFLNIASALGFETAFVNGEHVNKMRVLIFGDTGKTDRRDAEAINAVVSSGRMIVDRRRSFPEVYELLRNWGTLYQAAEDGIIESKARVHRAMRLFFPDFDFGKDFLYGPSGQAILRTTELDPHAIAPYSPSRLLERLRHHSRIRRSSVERLIATARTSATSTPTGERHEYLRIQLANAFEDVALHERRRAAARSKLESLYDEARAVDPRLPAPVFGVVSKIGLARLFSELGPITDFESLRQVLRYGGLNLRERQSGRYRGITRIARRGRPQLRRILNQLALPLVRKGCLFGTYYARKTAVEHMPGPKAMTAVSRKVLKMIWGWYHSGRAFDAARVFQCHTAQAPAA